MPRYFFDTYDGDRFVPDYDGIDLPDLVAARTEAQRALPDLARDALPDGDERTFAVIVKDEAGKVVLRAALTLLVDEGRHSS